MGDTTRNQFPEILTTGVTDLRVLPTPETLAAVQTRLAAYLREHGATCPPSDWCPNELKPQLARMTEEIATQSVVPLENIERWTWRRHTVRDPSDINNAELTKQLTESVMFLNLEYIATVAGADDLVLLVPTQSGEFVVPPCGEVGYTWDSRRQKHGDLPYAVLAQAVAILGAPCELRHTPDASPTILTWVDALLRDAYWNKNATHTLSCLGVPFYQWGGKDRRTPQLCAVLIAHYDRDNLPPTAEQWYEVIDRGQHAVEERQWSASQLNMATAPLPTRGAPWLATWRHLVTVLERRTIPWISIDAQQSLPSKKEESSAYHAALHGVTQRLMQLLKELGSPCPTADLHPAMLKQRLLEAMTRAEAESFSANTERSAVTLSHSARCDDAQQTMQTIVKLVEQQLATEGLSLTLFAHYNRDGFMVRGAFDPAEMEMPERSAYEMLAAIAALQGTPLFVTSNDRSNPLYPLARELIKEPAAFLMIPVYRWRDRELRMRPRLAGIFVAIFEEGASPPTELQWLQWQFLCQTLHMPLELIGGKIDDEHEGWTAQGRVFRDQWLRMRSYSD